MKTFSTLTLITLLGGFLMAGCATNKNGLALETVGPVPSELMTGSTNGTLVVYSGYKRNADFNSSDPYHQEYSDYKILADDGTLLRNVHNNSGTILADAVNVELPPGKYRIVARANGYGYLTIPVRLEAQEKTVLHLEGGYAWPDRSAFNDTNAVRLPGGEVIGWKSDL